MTTQKKINCLNCSFYYITWDKDFPYGCKAMGFKSKKPPMAAVYKNSGQQCLSFVPKEKKAK